MGEWGQGRGGRGAWVGMRVGTRAEDKKRTIELRGSVVEHRPHQQGREVRKDVPSVPPLAQARLHAHEGALGGPSIGHHLLEVRRDVGRVLHSGRVAPCREQHGPKHPARRHLAQQPAQLHRRRALARAAASAVAAVCPGGVGRALGESALALLRRRRRKLAQPRSACDQQQRKAERALAHRELPRQPAGREERLPVVRGEEVAQLEAREEQGEDAAVDAPREPPAHKRKHRRDGHRRGDPEDHPPVQLDGVEARRDEVGGARDGGHCDL
mmetsp:Transcript_26016/g.75334  ORF Transcript_26016/g.75334 Transcript_26016/m.75334 type:complete len:270 (-) Transcript_26016:714-1523(-)